MNFIHLLLTQPPRQNGHKLYPDVLHKGHIMATGKTIGYIRVSSADQNPERQLDGVKIDKTFVDNASGKDINRPQ